MLMRFPTAARTCLFLLIGACGPLGPTVTGSGSSDRNPGGSGTPVSGTNGTDETPATGGAGGGSSSSPDADSSAGNGTPSQKPSKPGDTIAAPPPGSGSGYTVVGPNIVDKNGQPHRFYGLDRPSLEWSAAGEGLSPEDYKRMASWNSNVVRIALNQGFWLTGSKVHSPGYRNLVAQNVRWAEEAGMDVILDLHWSDKGDYNVTPAQQTMADAHSVEFWKQVAAEYKDNPRVLFELYNEPHDVPWSIWRAGGTTSEGFVAAGMQQLYDAVRSAGAKNVVIIGGLRWAFDLSGVVSNPIQGYNIAYATHPYNYGDKQRGTWDAAFGFMARTAPVIATEFGDHTSCNTSYASQFFEYARSNSIQWTAWAWYPGGCQFPSLISDWGGTPTAFGEMVRQELKRHP